MTVKDLIRKVRFLTVVSFAVKPLWFLFITAVCMRILGAGEYGIMTAALALAALATSFTDLGTTKYILREASRDREQSSPLFTNFLVLRSTLSAIAFVVAITAAVLLNYSQSAVLAVAFAALYTLSLNITNYCRTFFEAYERLNYEAVSLLIEKTLVIGLGILMLLLTESAWGALAGMAAGMTTATLINIGWVGLRLTKFDADSLDFSFVGQTLRKMIPFGLAGLFTALYMRTPIVIVEAYLGETPAGQYGAAFRIFEALIVIPAVIAVAGIYPRLSQLFAGGAFEQFRKVCRNGIILLAAISFTVAAALSVLGPLFIQLLDPNPEFIPSGHVLQYLVWAFPLQCGAGLIGLALMAMEQQRSIALILGWSTAACLGLSVTVIPVYGILGAAITLVATEGLILGLMLWRIRTVWQRITAGNLADAASN